MTRTMVLTLILAMLMPMAMASGRNTARPSDKMREKLEIRIPKLSFQNARIEDVIAYLRAESKRLDPDGEGINIVYVKGQTARKPQAAAPAAQDDWLR